MVSDPVTAGAYVLVGDSAMFVDPLFSTGVHRALLSATHATAICRRLGAVGAKFFRNAHRDESLRMPETLSGRLSAFRVDIDVAQCQESAVCASMIGTLPQAGLIEAT